MIEFCFVFRENGKTWWKNRFLALLCRFHIAFYHDDTVMLHLHLYRRCRMQYEYGIKNKSVLLVGAVVEFFLLWSRKNWDEKNLWYIQFTFAILFLMPVLYTFSLWLGKNYKNSQNLRISKISKNTSELHRIGLQFVAFSTFFTFSRGETFHSMFPWRSIRSVLSL